MRLIIKGNMVDAILAANSHGVILDNPTTLKPSSTYFGDVKVIADTTADETLVRSWFMEQGQSAPLYPAGAALVTDSCRKVNAEQEKTYGPSI